MKIDAHQHFWRYSPITHSWINDSMAVLKRDFLPEDLKPELKKKSFNGCIAVQAVQSEAENDFLLDLADNNDFIKGVVGWLDLRADNIDERLAHYSKHPKFCGLRHVVQDEPDDEFLLRDDFKRGISKLKQYNLTYDILIFEKQLPAALKFVEAFPDQSFVLDHIAKPLIVRHELNPWKEYIQKLAEFPNVYCKVSGLVTEAHWKNWKKTDLTPYLDVVFEAFGTQRVMVGSDWPVCKLAASYEQVVDIIQTYIQGFSPTEKADIMGNNAANFYLNRNNS